MYSTRFDLNSRKISCHGSSNPNLVQICPDKTHLGFCYNDIRHHDKDTNLVYPWGALLGLECFY